MSGGFGQGATGKTLYYFKGSQSRPVLPDPAHLCIVPQVGRNQSCPPSHPRGMDTRREGGILVPKTSRPAAPYTTYPHQSPTHPLPRSRQDGAAKRHSGRRIAPPMTVQAYILRRLARFQLQQTGVIGYNPLITQQPRGTASDGRKHEHIRALPRLSSTCSPTIKKRRTLGGYAVSILRLARGAGRILRICRLWQLQQQSLLFRLRCLRQLRSGQNL